MKSHLNLIYVLFFGIALVGCGSEKAPSSSNAKSFQSQKLILKESQNLSVSENEISGTGSFVFDAPLSGVKADASFTLEFEISDGGMLELHTFTNSNLASSLILRINRSGNTLNASLVKDENQVALPSSTLSTLNASEKVKIAIDIHNNETPAHILIWSGEVSEFSEETAVFNSEDDGESHGNGGGNFWGLKISNVRVFKVSSGDAKFEHDH